MHINLRNHPKVPANLVEYLRSSGNEYDAFYVESILRAIIIKLLGDSVIIRRYSLGINLTYNRFYLNVLVRDTDAHTHVLYVSEPYLPNITGN